MDDDALLRRLASLELAVAHLTEAVEELAKSLDATASPKRSLIESHLRDIRENFNQVAARRSAT
ncbi:MAG TPA: hypothetical protein VKU86_05605 [Acidimicrobiales bacterium]|nr:hypothetical protein [Acidimicrobiales bacterium]